MKYIIDTAEQSEIDKWKDCICGVTSNPSLLEKSDISPHKFCEKNMLQFKNIFVQVNSLEEVNTLYGIVPYTENLVVKIPLLITKNFDGFKLLERLVKMGVRTCATIVYDLHQFNFACEIGSEFSIVLIAKNENKNFMSECYKLKMKKGYETKTVAASFRTAEQVLECIDDGADYSTVPPSVMTQLFSNGRAVSDYNKFYGIE